MDREESFVELAKQMRNAAFALSEATRIESEHRQRVDAAKSRAEEIKKKLRDYVGRNQPLKQTVVDGSLVRVEMKNIGDHDNTRVDVTVEELIY